MWAGTAVNPSSFLHLPDLGTTCLGPYLRGAVGGVVAWFYKAPAVRERWDSG
jgi:hypothetical protein